MNWDKNKVEELAELVTKYDLTEVEIRDEDSYITVKRAPATVQMMQGSQGFPMTGIQPRMNPDYRHITEKKAQLDRIEATKEAHWEETPVNPSIKKEGGTKYLYSPIAGIFYRQSQPGSPPYVDVGQRVQKGDTVCLVEAMKMIYEISADRDGIVKEFLVENEQFVEYDAPLVLIEEE